MRVLRHHMDDWDIGNFIYKNAHRYQKAMLEGVRKWENANWA